MTTTTKKGGVSGGAIATGVIGLTAAAIGAYYLYGHKDAAKNRAKVKGWMLKAKGEVLEKLEGVQEVTEAGYMAAVDAVLEKYNQIKSITPEELAEFIRTMKAHWKAIQKSVDDAGKPLRAKAGKTQKPRAKKAAAK